MKFGLENFRDFNSMVRQLAVGLSRLTFTDNFDSFEFSDTLASGAELTRRNPLTRIPKGYIIIKQKGNGLITAGETAWTQDSVTLKNHGPDSVEFTAVFLR